MMAECGKREGGGSADLTMHAKWIKKSPIVNLIKIILYTYFVFIFTAMYLTLPQTKYRLPVQ